MSKYSPLKQYLENLLEREITLTFTEIELILGFDLPRSAYIYSAWWANDKSHNQAEQSWLTAGWETCKVLLNNRVTFRKMR